jgi:hypothetical protein
MQNPFDPKTVLLAKHAQHVVLIHFPIALFIPGVAFDLMAQWTKQRGLQAAAYYNLLVAALSTLPVLATGILALSAAGRSPGGRHCFANRPPGRLPQRRERTRLTRDVRLFAIIFVVKSPVSSWPC